MLSRTRDDNGKREIPSHLVMVLDYTNHRGERSRRRVVPQRLWFGATSWHPVDQWLLEAFDLAKGAQRDFALDQIHGMWAEGTTEDAGHVLDRPSNPRATRRVRV